jgi:hypothetical protein
MREVFAVARAEHQSTEIDWLHTRELIATLINVNKGKKGKQVKGQDVLKLDLDEERKQENLEISKERLKYWQKIKDNGGLSR